MSDSRKLISQHVILVEVMSLSWPKQFAVEVGNSVVFPVEVAAGADHSMCLPTVDKY